MKKRKIYLDAKLYMKHFPKSTWTRFLQYMQKHEVPMGQLRQWWKKLSKI